MSDLIVPDSVKEEIAAEAAAKLEALKEEEKSPLQKAIESWQASKNRVQFILREAVVGAPLSKRKVNQILVDMGNMEMITFSLAFSSVRDLMSVVQFQSLLEAQLMQQNLQVLTVIEKLEELGITSKADLQKTYEELQKKAIEVGKARGSYKGRPGISKGLHPFWLGNNAGYSSKHKWILKYWAKTGTCQKCNENKKTEWANKTGNYDREVKDDWLELCAKCHRNYDRFRLRDKVRP